MFNHQKKFWKVNLTDLWWGKKYIFYCKVYREKAFGNRNFDNIVLLPYILKWLDGILLFRKGKRSHLNHNYFFSFSTFLYINSIQNAVSTANRACFKWTLVLCPSKKIIPGHHDATVLSNSSTLLGKKELYSHTKMCLGVVFGKAVSKFSSSSQFVGPQVPETFPNHVSGAEL